MTLIYQNRTVGSLVTAKNIASDAGVPSDVIEAVSLESQGGDDLIADRKRAASKLIKLAIARSDDGDSLGSYRSVTRLARAEEPKNDEYPARDPAHAPPEKRKSSSKSKAKKAKARAKKVESASVVDLDARLERVEAAFDRRKHERQEAADAEDVDHNLAWLLGYKSPSAIREANAATYARREAKAPAFPVDDDSELSRCIARLTIGKSKAEADKITTDFLNRLAKGAA